MNGRRLARFGRGLAGLVALGGIMIGLPLALYELGGSPVPARLPSWHQFSYALLHQDSGTGLFIGAVRDVSWVAWLAFAIAVAAELQAAARGRRAPKLRLLGIQGLAAKLIAMAALTFSAPTAVTLATSSAMAATVQTVTPAAHHHDIGARLMSFTDRDAPSRVVVVRSGDCLWTIAEHYLGAGDRYPEIVELNLGHTVGDGQVFTNPSLIEPGWRLELPTTPGSSGTAAPGSTAPGSGHHESGAHHDGHPSAHSAYRSSHPAAGHGDVSHGGAANGGTSHSGGTRPVASRPAADPAGGSTGTGGQSGGNGNGSPQAAGSATQAGATRSTEHDQVAEAALFTLGMLAGAALASIDRLRHRQRQYRRPGRRISLPADPAGRGIERKLRAAAARWPADRTSRAEDQDLDLDGSADFSESSSGEWQARRPQWPDLPEPVDLRGPAGNRLPAGGLEPFDADAAFGYADDDETYDPEFDPAEFDPADLDQDGFDPDDFDPDSDPDGSGPGGFRTRFEPADHGSARAETSLYQSRSRDDTDQYGSAEPLDARGTPATLRDALRDLSEGIATGGEPLPPIVGIHLTADTLDVLLSAPAAGPPPAPFTIAPARQAMCWTVRLGGTGADDEPAPPVPGEVGDLLPGLFTAGATEAGGYLLLDLEAMRVTCCDGPDALTDRLLVTAATELASSHWSGWYDLVLAGCDELDVLGRAELCADLEEALSLLESRAQAIARRMDDGGAPDVRTRRLADPDDEDWGLTLLVSRLRPTPAQMTRLLDLADGPGGIAALVAGDEQSDDGKLAPAVLQLAPDPERQDEIVANVTLAYLGPDHRIKVWPQTLTIAEYQALAGVFATASETADVAPEEPPHNDFGAAPWIRLAAAPVAPSQDGTYGGPDDGYQRFEDWASGGAHARPSLADDEDQQAFAGPAPYGSAMINGSGSPSPVTDQRPAAPRPAGIGPRHAAPSLQVKVLGPVEITGSPEPLLPKQAELLLALALHAPVGVSNSGLCTLLGPDADHPRPADSVRQLITRTRKRLGQARDGQEFIIHLGSGIYVPHGDLALDWASFNALARRGRAERNRADLRSALALVRGEPFADCYHWWIDIGLIETIRAEIVDTAELLSQLELAVGDPLSAAKAARSGLAAESAAEQLWRALMRAEYEAGRPDGVTIAWTGCLDAIAEIAPGGEPHPDTEHLFRELTRGAPLPSLR